MKLGIVGTGMIVRIVLPHLAEWGCDVRAICATPNTKDEAVELAKAYGGTPYWSFEDLLSDDGVDTVYIAVPNALHAKLCLRALEAGKHVIVEKPMTSNIEEAESIAKEAHKRNLLLFEAISTLYLPNYAKIRELLHRIGTVKVASCNYSQYSHRYDAFKAGEVLPAFDPSKSGGALMDLGLYNMHYLMGLFGTPDSVSYQANIERGIDTSGVLLLDYGAFKAVCVNAKDCAAPACNVIQGTEGYISQATPANNCGPIVLHLNDGTEERYDLNPSQQWESEFRHFAKAIDAHDTAGCYKMLEHSLAVSRAMTTARRAADVWFAADEVVADDER